MAKQDGFGMLRGKVGGFNFYSRNGKHFVGAETGVDKKRVKTAPEFELTRQNNEEFRVASAWNKAFRRALKIKQFGVQTPGTVAKFQGRIFKNIRTDQVNARGERQLQPQNIEQQFADFHISRGSELGDVFTEQITATHNSNGNHIFTIDAHDTSVHIMPPLNATHYRVTAIVTYPDPRPNNPYFINSNRQTSTELDLAAGQVASFNIAVNTPQSATAAWTAFWVGFEFLEYQQNQYFDMKIEKNDVISFLSLTTL